MSKEGINEITAREAYVVGMHRLGTFEWSNWSREGDKVTLTLTLGDLYPLR